MGHLAAANRRSVAGAFGLRMKGRWTAGLCLVFVVFVLAVVSFAAVVLAQSGRNKEKTPKPTPNRNRSVDPNPEPSKSPAKPSANTSASGGQSRPKDSGKD